VLGPGAGTSNYILWAGTSMASPAVAGLVALIFEENPNLDVNGVRSILTSPALSDGFTGSLPNNIYGYGKAFLSPLSNGSAGGGDSGGCSGGSGGDSGSGGGGSGCSMTGSASSMAGLWNILAWLSVLLFALVRRIRRK